MNKDSEENTHTSERPTPPVKSQSAGTYHQRMSLRHLGARLFSRTLSTLFALISSVLIVLIMSVLLFVYSQGAREWTVSQGIPALLSLTGIQLEIHNLHSPSASEWRLDFMSLRQNDTEIVRIEQLRLFVQDWSLFKQGLDIKELSAVNLYFNVNSNIKPEENKAKTKTGLDIPELLNQPLGLRLQELDVKRIELAGLETNIPALSIRGNALLNNQSSLDIESDNWIKIELKLEVLEPIPTQIRLNAMLEKRLSGHLDLSIEEAAGGWLGQQIDFPKQQNIDGQIKVQLHVDENNEQILWQMNALQLPWYQHQLGMNGSGSWQHKTHKLLIEHAEVLIDQTKQQLSGWWQDQEFALELDLKALPLALADPFQDVIKGGKVSGKVNASGNVSSPQFISSLDLQTNFLNRPATVKLEADGDLNRLLIRQAALQVDKTRAKLSGVVNIKQQSLDLNVQQLQGPVSVIGMFNAQLPQGLDIELLQTEGRLSGDIMAPNYSGKTKAKGRYKTQAFTLKGGFDGNIEQVKLISARLEAGEASLLANGLIDWHRGKLDLKYDAKEAPATLLSLAGLELPDNLSFQLASEGNVKGVFEQLSLDAETQIEGQFDTHMLNSIFSVTGTVNKLKFTDFKATLGGDEVHVNGTVEPLKQRLDLQVNQLQISTGILKTILPLPEELVADIKGQGVLKGAFTDLTFTGDVEANGQYKKAFFDISTALNASPEAVNFKELNSRLKMGDQSADIQVNGHYSIYNNTLDGDIKTAGLPLSIIELANLSLPEQLSGVVNADLSLTGSLPLPSVSGKLETRGQFNGDDFEVTFIGNKKDKVFVLEDVEAKWMNSSIVAKGELSQEKLDMHFHLKQFQVNELSKLGLTLPSGSPIPSGLLDVQFDLSGTLIQPQLKGAIELAIDERFFNLGFKASQEAIVLKSQIETQAHRLFLHTSVLQGETSKADIRIGVQLSPLLDWLLSQDKSLELSKRPLDISAQGEMELAWLNDWLQQDAHYIAGLMEMDMQILGNFDEPTLSGKLGVTGGKYQNAVSQTNLEQADIQLQFDGRKIEVVQATASDGLSGQVRLGGAIDLAAKKEGQIDLSLFLEKASLLRREDVEGEASGQLKLAGSLQDMRLSGSLDVAPFQIMLDRISSDSIPEIEVRAVQSTTPANSGNPLQPTVHIDLVINVDQQAFIRGRGLDAELKGKLQLSGTNRRTNYNGRFQVIRGTVDLFAKTFKLEQGSVLFSNEAVSLFAQARHKAKDLTFIATLEGLLDNLKISLRTEPALPEDEAVARLLFGKSVRNITPVQAIQLANAIQTLRGEGGQFDPLGTARDILNVDRITIESQETSEGNGVAIGLGKYVTDKVYIEVTRTPEPTQPWKGSVEVELTPNINLETTTSGSSGFGGVELQWKNDY